MVTHFAHLRTPSYAFLLRPRQTMRSHFYAFLICLFLLSIDSFAHFLPNITRLPNFTLSPWDAFTNFSGCQVGEKRDGLAKMKHYFHQFGYLPHSSNFTDEFDNSLAAALETYRLNFNLNQTDFLDSSTLKQIVLPRCGVADIINGTNTMQFSVKSNSTMHYTFFRTQPRWPRWSWNLTYSFAPENILEADVKEVFRRAFDRWEAVTPLTFAETGLFNRADIKISFVDGSHGDEQPFDGLLGILAHAFSPPDGQLHFDIEEKWVFKGDISTISLSVVDLESVAMHEIGHLLGLGHSSVKEAIMFPTIPTSTRKVELATDDIKGVQVLYGEHPKYNASDTQSASEMQFAENFKWALVLIIGSMLVML